MILNRDSLKELFRKGKFPSENHFAHLIDSSVNKMEDGIGKTPPDGLQLSPQGDFNSVLSVYERMDLPLPAWQINLLKDNEARGMSFARLRKNEDNESVTDPQLFLDNNGKTGIRTTSPLVDLHVNGTLGASTRVGTRHFGQVYGDGKWHNILSKLTGATAVEVVARIDGPPGRAKYALTHATALSTFGGKQSRNRIRQTRAYYGWFWNRIEFRWAGDLYDYSLQMRTRSHYPIDEEGKPSMIKFHLTGLWDDDLFNAPDGLTPK